MQLICRYPETREKSRTDDEYHDRHSQARDDQHEAQNLDLKRRASRSMYQLVGSSLMKGLAEYEPLLRSLLSNATKDGVRAHANTDPEATSVGAECSLQGNVP